MILYKAINYKDNAPTKMTSKFIGKYIEHSCFEDIITTAFTHVSHGDKKNVKDYWISTTKSFAKAVELMNNKKYCYNGIAKIELPDTHETGLIYDETLRERGYIDKYITNNEAIHRWQPNKDGIVLSLDMSSVLTINYLASYLWLKGNKNSLGNIRAYLNAQSNDEVLLLGENISFEFISKEDVEQYELIYKGPNIITDYYVKLLESFIELAPKSKSKEEMIKDLRTIIKIDESKYKDYNSCKMENKRKEVISFFYKNAPYTFNRQNAKKSFYEDKNILDSDKYRYIKKYDKSEIFFDDYLWAYVCSSVYIDLKLSGKLKKNDCIWMNVNELYDRSVIQGTVDANRFFEKYTKGLGIYPNNEPKRILECPHTILDDERSSGHF